MFSLNEEELQGLSNEVKSLQLQLANIEKFACNIRERSKATNPISDEDKNIFEKNLELILAIKNTSSFRETVIQYLLSNLFKSNIRFEDILNDANKSNHKLYSRQQREIKISAALITQTINKTYVNFPYSLSLLIVSYIQIDAEIKECKSSLKIIDEVELLFSKMRQNKDFSDILYDIFIRVDRKLFVPPNEYESCNIYDRPISLNYGVSLSAPHIHVHAIKQFEHLLTKSNDGQSAVTFLDVGCGTGYVCTLMAVGFVLNNTNESYFKSYGCIYNENLLKHAIEARNTLNLNLFLEFKHASTDMMDVGWKEEAPFDGIYCGAAIKETDCILLREQLKVNGYLMCVVEHRDSSAKQVMKLIKRVKKTDFNKTNDTVSKQEDKPQEIKTNADKNNADNDVDDDDDDTKKDKEEQEVLPTDFDGLKQVPTRKLNEYLKSLEIDPKSSEYNCIEKNDIIHLILNIQNEMISFVHNDDDDDNDNKEDEKNDVESDSDTESEKEEETKENITNIESNDEDFEVTDLFDVRFRTLRGRFQFLKKKEESLLFDYDDESD